MGVDIRKNFKTRRRTAIPNPVESGTREMNMPLAKCVRVNVVVKNKFGDLTPKA